MWEVSYELVRNLSPQTEGAWCSEVCIFISRVPAFPTVELNVEGGGTQHFPSKAEERDAVASRPCLSVKSRPDPRRPL